MGPCEGRKNWRKHRVSFETALRVFADPFALSVQDRVEDGEQRWQTLGMVGEHVLLLVAHLIHDVEEDDEAIEIIHLISARLADRTERRRYEQENR